MSPSLLDSLYDADVLHRSAPTGAHNAITDVPGLTVGQVTMRDPAQGICTGLTVVDPGEGIYRRPLPAARHVINGYGKSAGLMQIGELGELESPIAFTGVFGVPSVLAGLNAHMMEAYPEIGSEGRGISVNSVVLECNDSHLHDPRGVHPGRAEMDAALQSASGGPFALGAVGAGAGMRTFGFAGAIGSASRELVAADGTTRRVGVLTLSNYGVREELLVAGRPVGRRLVAAQALTSDGDVADPQPDRESDGSVIVLLATDLPATSSQLERIARRAQNGIARTGGVTGTGSGEIVLAFTTNHAGDMPTGDLNPVFTAVTEAVEESVLRGLLHAETSHGRAGREIPALAEADLAAAFPETA